MAIYCMSDIHGDYKNYIKMLELINFSDKDELYVIGDVIDRHPGGVDILIDIMARPNVHMILGNHEDMCYRGVALKDREAWSMWIRNGGGVTRKGLFYKDTKKYKDRIMAFLRSLPTFLEIEVAGNKFHLVHAAPSKYIHERLWFRADETKPNLIEGATVVLGHTPTCFLRGFDEPFSIYSEPGVFYIDCGAGSDHELRQLGCLRLDDLQEFYIRCVED